MESAGIKLYHEAVQEALSKAGKQSLASEFTQKAASLSNVEARALAKGMGVDPFWDWYTPRVPEGFFRYNGGTSACIARGIVRILCILFQAYSPYCDLIWMETKKPIYSQAKEFAESVKSVYPDMMLAYNLSPSFNWDAAGILYYV